MATCGCIGGGWMWMVAVGEVGKARRRGGDCYFLGWAMFWGSEVRRRGAFSMLFFAKYFTCREHPGSLRSDRT
jgi:hypothetical protein